VSEKKGAGLSIQAIPIDWSTLPSAASVAAQPPQFPPWSSAERGSDSAIAVSGSPGNSSADAE
jgi:hypothetical protein